MLHWLEHCLRHVAQVSRVLLLRECKRRLGRSSEISFSIKASGSENTGKVPCSISAVRFPLCGDPWRAAAQSSSNARQGKARVRQ